MRNRFWRVMPMALTMLSLMAACKEKPGEPVKEPVAEKPAAVAEVPAGEPEEPPTLDAVVAPAPEPPPPTLAGIWAAAAPYVPADWIALSVAGEGFTRVILEDIATFFVLPQAQAAYAREIRARVEAAWKGLGVPMGNDRVVFGVNGQTHPFILIDNPVPPADIMPVTKVGTEEDRVWQFMAPYPIFLVEVEGFGQAMFFNLEHATLYGRWLEARKEAGEQPPAPSPLPEGLSPECAVAGQMRFVSEKVIADTVALVGAAPATVSFTVCGDVTRVAARGDADLVAGLKNVLDERLADARTGLKEAAASPEYDWPPLQFLLLSTVPWLDALLVRLAPEGSPEAGQLAWEFCFGRDHWLVTSLLAAMPLIPGLLWQIEQDPDFLQGFQAPPPPREQPAYTLEELALPEPPTAPDDVPGLPEKPLPAVERLLPHLPSNTLFVVAARPAFAGALAELTLSSPIAFGDGQEESIRKAQADFLERELGLRTDAVDGVFLFVGGTDVVGMALAGDLSLLDGPTLRPTEIGGRPAQLLGGLGEIVFLPTPDLGILVFFSKRQARQYIQTVIDEKRVLDSPRRERVAALPFEGRDMATVVLTDHPMTALGWTSVTSAPLPDAFYLTLTGRRMELHVTGNGETLDAFEGKLAELRGLLEGAVRTAPGSEPGSFPGMFNSNGAYAGEMLAALSMVKRHERSLSMELEHNPPHLLTMARLGLSSVLVVPALLKYERKARSYEAIEGLQSLYVKASLHFVEPRVDEAGNRLPCDFPPSVSPTPAPNCCANQGGPDTDEDGRCDPAPENWAADTWKALDFRLDEPHHFVYEFKNLGPTDDGIEFEISAYGDLDCDGEMSTFRRWGIGKVEEGNCFVESKAALFSQNETE